MGTNSHPRRGTAPHQFSAHVCCSQTAGRMKMLLGIDVGLDPGDILLDGDTALSKRGTAPPLFGPCLLWPNAWMDQGVSWYEGGSRPRQHCVRWGPSSPERGTAAYFFGPCLFWPNGRLSQPLLSTANFNGFRVLAALLHGTLVVGISQTLRR